MKEDRCREYYRVQPVQHAAVTFDHRAPVLDAAIALDCRHDEAAQESHGIDDERDHRRLPQRERRDPPKRAAEREKCARLTEYQAIDEWKRKKREREAESAPKADQPQLVVVTERKAWMAALRPP